MLHIHSCCIVCILHQSRYKRKFIFLLRAGLHRYTSDTFFLYYVYSVTAVCCVYSPHHVSHAHISRIRLSYQHQLLLIFSICILPLFRCADCSQCTRVYPDETGAIHPWCGCYRKLLFKTNSTSLHNMGGQYRYISLRKRQHNLSPAYLSIIHIVFNGARSERVLEYHLSSHSPQTPQT